MSGPINAGQHEVLEGEPNYRLVNLERLKAWSLVPLVVIDHP